MQLCDFGLARKLSDISKTPSSLVCFYQLLQQLMLYTEFIIDLIIILLIFPLNKLVANVD